MSICEEEGLYRQDGLFHGKPVVQCYGDARKVCRDP